MLPARWCQMFCVVVASTVVVQLAVADDAPENDLCGAAVVLGEGTMAFDTEFALTDGPSHEACQFDGQTYRDVWYDFVAIEDGTLTVSTCDLAWFDTDLVLYDGCGCPVTDARVLACNDDAPDCALYTSMAEASVVAGGCYKIRVGGFHAYSYGQGVLEVSFDPFVDACTDAEGGCWGLAPNTTPGCEDPGCCDQVCGDLPYCCEVEWDAACVDHAWATCGGPTGFGACCVDETCIGVVPEDACDGYWFAGENCAMVDCTLAAVDYCEEAMVISEGETGFDTTYATTDGPAHECCDWDGQTYNDIWFEYIATATGDLIVTTCEAADYNTDLVVYDGCACPVDDDRVLGCNDDDWGCTTSPISSTVVVPVVQDQCYKLRVGGYEADSFGTGTLSLSVQPVYDACLASAESCWQTHEEPGCQATTCCNRVCEVEESCCVEAWTDACRALALEMCVESGACCYDGCADGVPAPMCVGQFHPGQSCEEVNCLDFVCFDGDGGCWGQTPNDTPGCDDSSCCGIVCDRDASCCGEGWDDTCTELAWRYCGGPDGFGACCLDGACVGVTAEQDCEGDWHAGINCDMIDCAMPIADHCPGVAMVPGQTYVGSTMGLTQDHDATYCGTTIDTPGAWYAVVGTGHTLTATTCDSPFTDYDTKISVYCANCDDLVCVGSNDDMLDPACAPLQSSVTFCSLAGATYYVLVHGFAGETGTFGLSMIEGEGCTEANPACATIAGACCDGETCVGDTLPEACNGAWYSGMTCAAFVCPTGACCEGDTCVGTTPESTCGGHWYVGQDCETFDCPTCDYCDVCFGSNNGECITEVVIGGIHRISGRDGLCSYADATQLSTYLLPGETYPISVTLHAEPVWPGEEVGGFFWDRSVSAFADFDQDCVFDEDAVFHIGCSHVLSATGDVTITGELVVPEDAAPGCTRMRVVDRWFEAPADGCAILPYDWGEAEDYTVCIGTEPGVALVETVPAHDHTLSRSNRNYLSMTFTGHVEVPPSGGMMIQQLLEDGAYGPDLADQFSVTVDGADVVVVENASVLTHSAWYAVRNVGVWQGVAPFEVHLLLAIGDANGDGRVLPADLSLINTEVPLFHSPPGNRLDINGDGRVLPNDMSVANTHIPTFDVPKPTGH